MYTRIVFTPRFYINVALLKQRLEFESGSEFYLNAVFLRLRFISTALLYIGIRVDLLRTLIRSLAIKTLQAKFWFIFKRKFKKRIILTLNFICFLIYYK